MLLILDERSGRSSTFIDHNNFPFVLISIADNDPSNVLTKSKKLKFEKKKKINE